MGVQWAKIASVTTTGSAGSATGDSGTVSASGSNPLPSGTLYAIYIDFTSMPATTDVTISEVLPTGALRTLLITTNVNTDGVFLVQLANATVAGAAGTGFVYPVVGGSFKVTVAQADALADAVAVYMMIAPF